MYESYIHGVEQLRRVAQWLRITRLSLSQHINIALRRRVLGRCWSWGRGRCWSRGHRQGTGMTRVILIAALCTFIPNGTSTSPASCHRSVNNAVSPVTCVTTVASSVTRMLSRRWCWVWGWGRGRCWSWGLGRCEGMNTCPMSRCPNFSHAFACFP